jgi:hypothetical protein
MDPLSAPQVEDLSAVEFSVDNVAVTDREGDRAVVRVTITARVADRSRTTSRRLELRRHDGRWRIYSVET